MKMNKEIRAKLQKFKRDKRAYASFLVLFILFIITLPAELLCNVRPIVLSLEGKLYFPLFITYSEQDFGGSSATEPDYKSQYFLEILRGKPDIKVSAKPKAEEPSEETFAMNLGDFDDEEDFDPTMLESEPAESSIPEPATDDSFVLTLEDFDEDSAPAPDSSDGSFVLNLDDFDESDWENVLKSPAPANAPKPVKKQATQTQPGSASKVERNFWMLWPPIRYDYKYIATTSQSGREVLAAPFKTQSKIDKRTIPSSWVDGHYLGTDDRGRDVLARLIYGFRISMIFGLSLAISGTIIGCLLGGVQGYFGGWIDLLGQRFTEIWGSMPRLYILIILSSFLAPSALLLFLILNLTAWMGIAAYIRAEFLKGRNLEYVKAAKAMGVSDFQIMRKHILPNSLTPVITFFPFEVTAGILALVSLDFLNLGVPSPAPSIGELLAQGKSNLQATWIILPTFLALTLTLSLLTFVGEGIRNAFDPRRA